MAEIILSKNSPNQKKEITPEQEKFIRENYLLMNDADLAKALKVSATKIYKWCLEMKMPGRGNLNLKKEEEKHEDYFNWRQAKKDDFIFNNV